jgi:hypothetical protein
MTLEIPKPSLEGTQAMAPPTTRARAHWNVDRATSLPEIWALIAAFAGLVGAWRLTGVCRAARAGAREYLGTMPGMVVVYGTARIADMASNVWRLDLASLRWNTLPSLMVARYDHACCAVRGSVAVIGGRTLVGDKVNPTASVEVLSSRGGDAPMSLPPLSCGGIDGAAAIAVGESDSAAGQVLLLGGADAADNLLSTVQLINMATGVCTLQPHLLNTSRVYAAAARLPDGRVVCAGGIGEASAEVLGPPKRGRSDLAWAWTKLPAMSIERMNCRGCVMSDGRFAILGGETPTSNAPTSSCEALTLGDGARWQPLPPMHEGRQRFACAAVAGCIIVAGGLNCHSAEVFDEVLGRWLRLPNDLPHASRGGVGGVLL